MHKCWHVIKPQHDQKPVLSNVDKVSCSRIEGIEPTTTVSRVCCFTTAPQCLVLLCTRFYMSIKYLMFVYIQAAGPSTRDTGQPTSDSQVTSSQPDIDSPDGSSRYARRDQKDPHYQQYCNKLKEQDEQSKAKLAEFEAKLQQMQKLLQVCYVRWRLCRIIDKLLFWRKILL